MLPHLQARRSSFPRSASKARAACRSRAGGPGQRPSGPSCFASRSCLRGRVCIVRRTRVCRTEESVIIEYAGGRGKERTLAKRAMALTTSVDLFMTITAPVPRPDWASLSESKSILPAYKYESRKTRSPTHKTSSHIFLGKIGTELPPGTIPNRLSHPPTTPPQCFSTRSFSGILISSSITHGLFTCPDMQNSLVPWFRARPNDANHAPPRRQMVGATATVSTLATVVGHPKSPTSAGKGGLRRGLPCLPGRACMLGQTFGRNEMGERERTFDGFDERGTNLVEYELPQRISFRDGRIYSVWRRRWCSQMPSKGLTSSERIFKIISENATERRAETR
jgi:hypothetical protein